MRTFVLDSDGLIKLIKSSIAEVFLEKFSCFISQDVYEEVVVRGKEGLYEDAFAAEALIAKGKLKVKEVEEERAAKILTGREELGKGERSSLHLFFGLTADAIITDDKAFIKILSESNVPFIIPSDVIASLARLRLISEEQAMKALNSLRPYIHKGNYAKAKRVIEGAG